MRNKLIILSCFVSVISITISIIAITSTKYIHIDNAGILVSVLSILVTILVGWNIYSFIDFKEKSKENEAKLKMISKNTENRIKKFSKKNTEIAINEFKMVAFYLQGNIRIDKEREMFLFTYYSYQSALWFSLKQETTFSEGLLNTILKEMKLLITKIGDSPSSNDNIGDIEKEQLISNLNDIILSGNKNFNKKHRETFTEIYKKIGELYKIEWN